MLGHSCLDPQLDLNAALRPNPRRRWVAGLLYLLTCSTTCRLFLSPAASTQINIHQVIQARTPALMLTADSALRFLRAICPPLRSLVALAALNYISVHVIATTP